MRSRPTADLAPATPATTTPLKPTIILRILAAEAGPILLFFVAFSVGGIFVATAVFMVAAVLSVAVTLAEKGRWPTFPLLGAILVLVFGGLTLALGEATFIKIKPTVSNALFGAIILVGTVFGANVLKRVFGDHLLMRDRAWRALALRTGLFMLTLAALNEIVRLNFSTEAWVWFKVFGILPLDAAFAASQWPLIRREHRAAMGTKAPEMAPAIAET